MIRKVAPWYDASFEGFPILTSFSFNLQLRPVASGGGNEAGRTETFGPPAGRAGLSRG
jgi:hypothetical protein